jgi:tRNA 2-selenouridine synthase
MAHILGQVGWSIGKLEGGYKQYRKHVLAELERLPATLEFRVLCGPTGSGKSRLLETLAQRGAQVLDLEKLAQHRGSLLGYLPGQPQPAQKLFDSRVWQALSTFDPQKPIFVEAESRKIGQVVLPSQLLDVIRLSACLRIEAPMSARIALLKEDYDHFLSNPALLKKRLATLESFLERAVLAQWQTLIDDASWDALIESLLTRHYDPTYARSTGNNFPRMAEGRVLSLARLDAMTLDELAGELVGIKR